LAPRRVVASRGLRFTLQCENWITQYRWQTFNTKEPETLDWVDRWVRDGDTVFDIGANIGVYTIYAALRHPTARIIAFEPEYANAHLLRDNLLANSLQERVAVYSVAVGNRSGLSHLHLHDVTPGAALATESRDILTRTLAGQPVVCREGTFTLTLDAFCEQTGLTPNAMKIDVDGTEPSILEGGSRTIGSPALRSVMLEMPEDASSRRACAHSLAAAGLQRQWTDPRGRSPNELWVRA
jgi:FkbM family methyltransferase